MKYSSSKLEEWESDSSEVAKLSRLTLPPELGKESVLNKLLFQPLSRPIDSLINPIFFLNYQIKFKIQWKDSTLILRDPFYVSLCLNSKAFNKSHHCFYSCVIMWNLLRGAFRNLQKSLTSFIPPPLFHFRWILWMFTRHNTTRLRFICKFVRLIVHNVSTVQGEQNSDWRMVIGTLSESESSNPVTNVWRTELQNKSSLVAIWVAAK